MPALEYFMGSISSSLTSTPVTTAGDSSSSTTFKGTSSYSSDFQNVIDRSVAIATLPITLFVIMGTRYDAPLFVVGAVLTVVAAVILLVVAFVR